MPTCPQCHQPFSGSPWQTICSAACRAERATEYRRRINREERALSRQTAFNVDHWVYDMKQTGEWCVIRTVVSRYSGPIDIVLEQFEHEEDARRFAREVSRRLDVGVRLERWTWARGAGREEVVAEYA